MKLAWPRMSVDRDRWPALAGGLGSLAIAAVIYSQFSVFSWLKRDSAIYMYGGQQMLHGNPPYASIMDPKGPLAHIVCGAGSAIARLLGRDDVIVIRIEFGVLAALSVLGIYLLSLELFGSVVAGLVAAAVFASFEGYARDALAGPNGHTPGILFAILTLWLAARRTWFWAGFSASLAFLDWQPLFPYAVVVVVCAAVWSGPPRWKPVGRACVGGLVPFTAVVAYYAFESQLHALIEGLFVFPLTGATPDSKSPGESVRYIFHDVSAQYGVSGKLLWIGIVLLLVGVTWTVVKARSDRRKVLTGPLVLLVLVSFAAQVVYAVYDYRGYSHAFPLLIYGALGFGMATAAVVNAISLENVRQIATVAVLTAVVVVTAAFAVDYHRSDSRAPALKAEQASACAIQSALVPGTPLWAMGNPLPLVLLHRRNPDNYSYLGAGLDLWKVQHTRGGFAGWTAQVIRSRASVIVVDVWQSPMRLRMQAWLSHHGFVRGYIGPWQVFVTRQALAAMPAQGVALMRAPGFYPRTSDHMKFTTTRCDT